MGRAIVGLDRIGMRGWALSASDRYGVFCVQQSMYVVDTQYCTYCSNTRHNVRVGMCALFVVSRTISRKRANVACRGDSVRLTNVAWGIGFLGESVSVGQFQGEGIIRPIGTGLALLLSQYVQRQHTGECDEQQLRYYPGLRKRSPVFRAGRHVRDDGSWHDAIRVRGKGNGIRTSRD